MESPLKNNSDQQAASVQLPWLEQQQRDREALAAETDQAPPQEPTAPAVAEQEQEPDSWTDKPPTESGLYWHWDGHEDNAPLPLNIGWSGGENRCFVMIGQYGITEPVYVEEEGGFWMKLDEPLPRLKNPWNRRPAAPVAVGETPETDALLENLRTLIADRGRPCGPADLERVGNHARNLERQRDAVRRERDEAKSKLDAYIKSEAEHTDALAQKSAEALEGINALTAERDRLREENKTLKETRQRTVEELVKTRPYLTLMSECNNLKSALATAQADIVKLCIVIAAAFAETKKPLNASVEYDATPTAEERLKKVQEILSSAIDTASTDQIAESSMVPMPSQFGTHPHDMAVGPCACGATHKLTDWPKAVRDALDAASATEAKRIPVKVRMAKDLGPDLWAIMAPNTPRFWVKKGDEVPVKCNQHGAMTLLTPHGELGVKPQECEIIEWQYPASAT